MTGHWMLRTIARLLGHRGLERRANPLLAAYRWRYELATLALLVAGVQLGRETHWLLPVGIVLVPVLVAAAWPPFRAALRSRYWSIVIQHRLRTAFREAGVTTWAGRVPAILWATPRPAGVRVLVSCPGGVSVQDLEALRPVMAAACFAVDVFVERHPRYANLVTLFVVTSTVRP